MMKTREDVFAVMARIIATEAGGSAADVTGQTTAVDVPGWDSLAHTRIVMSAEAELGVLVDVDKTYRAKNVSELVDIFLAAQT